jgi:NAD(P)H-dependent FMN reductase
MPTPRILAFSGSLRRDSFNQRLVRIAAGGAERAGAEVTTIELRELPLPMYDQDLEAAEGRPGNVDALKDLFRGHDGLLIASPEYNSSFSAALKNAIDWVSRNDPGEPPLSCFAGKVAGIMATSPGGLGGLRGLVHLRSLLQSIQVTVVPHQVALPAAHEAFGDNGTLADERKHGQVEKIGADVTAMLAKLLA